MLRSIAASQWTGSTKSSNGCERTVSLWYSNLAKEFADYTSESKEKAFVYWRSVQEVASAIYAWADKNAKIGSVETLVDMCEDSESRGEIFHKMPIEIVLKACYALQEVGKAEVFASEETDSIGVKFFHHG